MYAPEHTVLTGTPHISGYASGELLASDLELSFWGGVKPETGEVIDRFHPLSGCSLTDKILAIPGGRGSCTGSVIIMELILNGLGPKALIFERCDEIITLGVIIAEEFFGKNIPILTLSHDDFQNLSSWKGQLLYLAYNRVSNAPLNNTSDRTAVDQAPVSLDKPGFVLSAYDQEVLAGLHSEGTRLAMRSIIRLAHMMEASELISVTQAHFDGAYYGPGSVAFAKTLLEKGAKFRVPSTVNSINIDQKRWRSLGVALDYGNQCDDLAQVYLEMGSTKSYTCAPYLLDTAPKLGDAIAWGESNAVLYANSVIGARTLKTSNLLDVLIAITGRAPKGGAYLSKNRIPSIQVKVPSIEDADDSFWPTLGYTIGTIASNRVPVVTGLEHSKPSQDDLKSFAAAFGTTSSACMFHIVNVTPEAPTLGDVLQGQALPECTIIAIKHLGECWNQFNQGATAQKVDLISFGNPHLSSREIKKLAGLCKDLIKHPDVVVAITCGRAQYSLAAQAGHVEELERFGVQFLTDTCWCTIQEPIIPKKCQVIMTNSGKYIHYGPGITGRNFCFGSLEMCVAAACSGQSTGGPPKWLQGLC